MLHTGFPEGVTGPDLMDKMRAQVLTLPVDVYELQNRPAADLR